MIEEPYIILEIGTFYTRVGFSSNNEPYLTIRTIITMDNNEENFRIGDDALNENIKVQNVILPIVDKHIKNYDYLENFLYNLFFIEMNLDLENKNIIIINSIFNHKNEKDIMSEIFFETYNVNGILFLENPILSFLSLIPVENFKNENLEFKEILNSVNGIRVELGDGETSIVPIANGFTIKSSCKKFSINGKQITKFILNELKNLNPKVNIEVLNILSNEIKENFCTLERKAKPDELQEIKINDLNLKINGNIKNAYFMYFEKSNLEDKQDLVEKIFYSYRECPIDIRKDIVNNIIITGGNAGVPGLKEYIHQNLLSIIKKSNIKTDININVHPLYLESSWIGANLYTYKKDFDNLLLKKELYLKNNLIK